MILELHWEGTALAKAKGVYKGRKAKLTEDPTAGRYSGIANQPTEGVHCRIHRSWLNRYLEQSR
ncbi:transposon Tn21 resolvase [Mycolicibacterium brisbanense]|uniref:Transposon Tn21 resolvase n=1 Tax=Mycolicibacterium brisbanense TaxID=146020 RepID=A0A100W398_9MYCO|nr:transposon Tn21 resolvase [Mycolicibacterium brisbanense]